MCSKEFYKFMNSQQLKNIHLLGTQEILETDLGSEFYRLIQILLNTLSHWNEKILKLEKQLVFLEN